MKKGKRALNISFAKRASTVLLFALLFSTCKNFLVKPFYDRFGNDEPALAGKVIILGFPLADSVLTADTSALNAPGPFSYQWRLDGVNIPGATGPDHTIDSADLHGVLTVVVSCDGYSGFVVSTPFTVTGSLILMSTNGGEDVSYSDLESALVFVTSSQNYVIKIGADQSLAQYPLNNGNVTLIAQNNPITIQLSNSGYLFTINGGATLTLDNGVSIRGLNTAQGGSATPMINVQTNGAFIMKTGSLLTGNASNNSGGAVYINGNNANFTMLGGTIAGNSTDALGGAVFVDGNASFVMQGGVISGNSSVGNGGGVYIVGNGIFKKTGGTLYGVNGGVNANTTSSGEGHAAYHASSPEKIRTNTAGPTANMDSNQSGTLGGWDTGAVYVMDMGGSTLTPFTNLQDALASLTPGRTYNIIIGKNQTIAPNTVLPYSGNFTLRADNPSSPVEVKISANGTMFSLSSGMMLTLENGVVLKGRNLTDDGADNDRTLINISGGTLNMKNGSAITGNAVGSPSSGGAVFVEANGNFIMDGGDITNNKADSGGGVFIGLNGSFSMSGGNITYNHATEGGGICAIGGGSSFALSGGYVSVNEASSGGGIYVGSDTALTMDGGTISSNTATNGGGVYVYDNGTLFMSNGFISQNKANDYGGGVYISSNGIIQKSAGTIYGANNPTDSNLADFDNNGTGLGHAAYMDGGTPKIRDNTAGPGKSLTVTSDWETD